jgi:hypothetical protein
LPPSKAVEPNTVAQSGIPRRVTIEDGDSDNSTQVTLHHTAEADEYDTTAHTSGCRGFPGSQEVEAVHEQPSSEKLMQVSSQIRAEYQSPAEEAEAVHEQPSPLDPMQGSCLLRDEAAPISQQEEPTRSASRSVGASTCSTAFIPTTSTISTTSDTQPTTVQKKRPEITFDYSLIISRKPKFVSRQDWRPSKKLQDLTLSQLLDEVLLQYPRQVNHVNIRVRGPGFNTDLTTNDGEAKFKTTIRAMKMAIRMEMYNQTETAGALAYIIEIEPVDDEVDEKWALSDDDDISI